MAQISALSHPSMYLTNKAKFERLRRKIRLNFDELYRLFARDLPSVEIAKKAGVSRPRITLIYNQYFGELFGMTDLQRRHRREDKVRQKNASNLARVIGKDRAFEAISQSANKANRKIEPIIYRRGTNQSRRYRHRAVLVDGKDMRISASCSQRPRVFPGWHCLWNYNAVSQPA